MHPIHERSPIECLKSRPGQEKYRERYQTAPAESKDFSLDFSWNHGIFGCPFRFFRDPPSSMPTDTSPLRHWSSGLCVLLLLFTWSSPGQAQLPSSALYGTGTWDADSLGNHRVVLQVREQAGVVIAEIPWRRRDTRPEQKNVVIVDATTGSRVLNAHWIRRDREAGVVVFQPTTSRGRYFAYYLLYLPKGSKNYPKGSYQPFQETASPEWLRSIAAFPPDSLPRVLVEQFQSIDPFNSFYPMEVIATASEVQSMVQSHKDRDYLLFPEERSHSIRMTTDLPYHWAASGPADHFEGEAARGEFFVFQIGVYAARSGVTVRDVVMSDLRGDGGGTIRDSRLSSFNTGGRDWKGRRFARSVAIGQGHVQALWLGVQIDNDLKPGKYQGNVTVIPDGMPPQSIRLSVTVSGRLVEAHGDNDPERLTRLRWLDSRLAQDDSLIKPFIPVTREEETLHILGRSVMLAESGLPAQITRKSVV